MVLLVRQKYADAEHYLRKAVAMDSTSAKYAENLAVELDEQHKYPEAEHYARIAAGLDSSNPDYQDELRDLAKHLPAKGRRGRQ
jgi:Flp pilus assembly protein TadD